MKKITLKTIASVFILVVISFGCQNNKKGINKLEQLPYYNEASFSPVWLNKGNDSIDNLHKIPSFTLTNQDSKTITEKDFEDKIYVTDFFFTACPGICPKMAASMKTLQTEFLNDDEVLLLSHSVTPDNDTPEVLKAYADGKGILSNKWHLVTGNRKEIYNLGRKEYFVEENLGMKKGDDEFLHTENFVLIDKESHIRGIYNGLNKTAVDQLIDDIKLLKTE